VVCCSSGSGCGGGGGSTPFRTPFFLNRLIRLAKLEFVDPKVFEAWLVSVERPCRGAREVVGLGVGSAVVPLPEEGSEEVLETNGGGHRRVSTRTLHAHTNTHDTHWTHSLHRAS
jgi:hypothetical protein